MHVKKTKKLKENRPENYHVHDTREMSFPLGWLTRGDLKAHSFVWGWISTSTEMLMEDVVIRE